MWLGWFTHSTWSKLSVAHGNASIHKDEQNQSQNNIQQLITVYFDLFEFLAFLCFLGPNLRWRLAHLWEILIDPKQRLDGTFVLKQQKAPVVFQRLLDQFYAPFFLGLDWGARKIGYKCTCLTNKKYAQEKERSWGTWVNFTGGQSNSRNVHQLQQ